MKLFKQSEKNLSKVLFSMKSAYWGDSGLNCR